MMLILPRITVIAFIVAVLTVLPGRSTAEEPLADPYLVQPGDILQISVWKEQDMQREVLVRPDGRFSFPLIGEVDVREKSVGQLQAELTQRIHQFIADPAVIISVKQVQGNRVFVIGQVNRPGDFAMNGRVDVVQALSMAGGMTAFAKAGSIRILRRDRDGEQQAIRFNFNDIEKGKGLAQNIILQSGDVVVVP